MKGRLLTPSWVLLHLVFLAAVVTSGWLGWWQWERAHEAGGSFQNLGYALQWPLFGAFALFLWYQVVRMANGTDQEEAAEPVMHPALSGAGVGSPVSGDSARAESNAGDAGADRRGVAGRPKRSPVPERAPSVTEEEDPQLAEYNRYLAELNAADSRRG
ncbi:hypothetical protein CDG81_04890 [Actinopolyspora erythraea]|uniref:Uncharacterized protein n=1 Tax=Actinopolyspora erythraea TaxID=414996 RepID=A0A223RYK2_9ACTN|nr:hypothetical protein [Actinopolyspora erythraea]ASU80839.1 hypothetical protein CDG81_04890 [Actinopolyspora erythraea]